MSEVDLGALTFGPCHIVYDRRTFHEVYDTDKSFVRYVLGLPKPWDSSRDLWLFQKYCRLREEQDAAKRSKTVAAAEACQALNERRGIGNLRTVGAQGKEVFGSNRAQELRDALHKSRVACSRKESDKAQSMKPQDNINAETKNTTSRDMAEVTMACTWCLRERHVRTPSESARCLDLQRQYGCHKCGEKACCSQSCTRFPDPRPLVRDAPTTGHAAPDLFERTPVRIQRVDAHQTLVEWNAGNFVKGSASGAGCNCLIQTLLACLNDNGIRCDADVPWIRQELQKQFPTGENKVTHANFLDLRNHWDKIIDLIGVSARRKRHDRLVEIYAGHFRVTCVLEDARRVVEEVGEGDIDLFMLNEGNYHFVPLLRNCERWGN